MSKSRNIDKTAKDNVDSEPFCQSSKFSVDYTVHIAHQLLKRELRETLKITDVSPGQWFFLRALWKEDGLTQKELGAGADLTESTTVVALKGMEKSKLIYRVRDAGDRRKVRIYLTETGRGVRENLQQLAWKINERATVGISPKDMRKFYLVMKQITENLRKPRDE